MSQIGVARVDRDVLRRAIAAKYTEVASTPELGFHFHTGRPLALMLGYPSEVIDRLPAATVASFAGMGNPFLFGALHPGEQVVDVGCGAGLDTLIAAQQVGPRGRVIAIDMTPEMRAKTVDGARELGLSNVDVREGFAEALPVADDAADVIISNGVVNLCANKRAIFSEILRVLRPGGHLQFADIANGKPVPEAAIQNIDLWTA